MKKIYLFLVLSCLCCLTRNAFGQSQTFNYTGGLQTYTVSAGCTSVSVDAIGGCGGQAYICCGGTNPVTLGGRVQCVLAVSGGEVLYVYVGGAGTNWTSGLNPGGFNGGGAGGEAGDGYAAGGGGASDIRTAAGTITAGTFGVTVQPYTAANRLVVAGGGGGGGDESYTGGAGGGTTAASGQGGACGGSTGGPSCGTGSALGVVGVGGSGNNWSVGGGGGGYYGGNGGVYDYGGGGGGSSYTNPSFCTGIIHTPGYSGANGNGKVTISTGCPGVVAAPTTLSFGVVGTGTTSPMQAFALSGFNLTGSLTITPPANYQISADGGFTFSSAPITYSSFSGGGFTSTIFYVEFLPTAAITYCSGNIAITGGGISSAYNIAVCGTGAAPCTGTPTAGSATINGSSSASGNGSTVFTLNAPTATVGGGITYQWQVSTTSSSTGFSNIPGANTASYTYTGLAANSWFQCVVTCGSASATTSTVAATFTLPASSCTPSSELTTTSYYVGTTGAPVTINGVGTPISDASACTGGSPAMYYNNVSQHVTFSPGATYSAVMGNTSCYVSGSIWIDFNDNGTFETSELVGGYANQGCPSASSTYNGSRWTPSIVIPATGPGGSTLGAHRMRVQTEYNGNEGPGLDNPYYPCYPQMIPCPSSTAYTYAADTRDYTAIIAPPTPTVTATPASVTIGNTTVLTSSAPVGYFALNGSNLVPSIGYLTATSSVPSAFLVSLNGSSWSSSVNIPYTTTPIPTTNVYVQFNPSSTGSFSGNININGGGIPSTLSVPVSGTGSAACTGTPVPGTASISTSVANGSSPITLSITPTTSGGITYQWQSSPSGTGSWTNIAGAITPTYSFVGISAATYYQCLVTCSSGGTAASSNVVSVGLVPSEAGSSCTISAAPDFCSGCYFDVAYTGYPLVIAGDVSPGINDASVVNSISTSYADLSATQYCVMHSGTTYTATVGGMPGDGIAVQFWIDFNGDGMFQASESVGGANPGTTRTTVTLTIPAGVSNGVKRMRVMADYDISGDAPYYYVYPNLPPCPSGGYPFYYEIRDYAVIFGTAPPTNASPCAGTPNPGIVSPSQSASCAAFSPNLYGVGETITASGITYQWQSSTSATGPFANISGATGQGYVPAPISTVGTTYYRDSVGCSVSTLGSKTPPQAITLNPQPSAFSNTSVCTGLTVSLTSSPTGGTWTSSNTAQATVSGVGAVGTVTGVSGVSTPNISYTLPTGCSAVATVTVNVNPTAISGTTPICGSLNSLFTDGISGGAWSSSNASIASVGSTGLVTGGASGGTANIIYTSSSGCSTTFPVTVNPLSAITGSASVCVGYTTSLTDGTAGGAWSSSNTGVATINSSGLVTSVAIGSATISYTMPTTSCTATKVVNITPPPSVYTMAGGGVYCSGGSGGSGVVGAHVLLNGSDPGISYQLYNGATPVGSPVIGSGFYIDFGLQPVGCYGVIANPGTPCSTTMAGTSCVTVNPLPTAYTVSGGGNYCAGGTGVHVYLNGSTIGITYQLFCATVSSGTIPIGSVVSGTSASLDFGLQTTIGVYTIVGTNTTTGCIGNMAGSVTVSTNPLPAVQTVSASGSGYCVGSTGVTIGLLGSVLGTSYQLTFSGAPFGAPVAGTGGAVSFGPQTTGGTYVVTATTTATGCTTTMSGTPSVTVNPLPTAFNVTGGGNYCVGSTTGMPIGLSGSTTGVNYQLYYTATVGGTVNPVSGTLVAGTGGSISFGSSFLPLGSYSVQAVNPATTCTNNMTGSVAIGTNPLPAQLSVGGGGAYCAGTTPHDVTLSGSVAGTTYNLLNGTTLTGAASGTGASIDFGPEATPGTYTVTAAITATGCTNTMLGNTLVSINPLPNVFNVQAGAAGTSYCNSPGALGDTINLSNSNAGISYQLFNGGTPSGTAVPGTGSPISFGPHTSGAYTVVATNTSTACINNMTGSVAITANALPTVYALTGGGNFCAGGTGVPIGLSASNTGISYSLLRGATTVSTLAGAGAPINFGLQSVLGTYTITANNPTTTCSVTMSGSTVVGTNPLPVATYNVTVSGGTGGGNYCAGSAGPVVGLSSSDAGINYQLLLGGVPAPGTAPVAGIASSPIAFPPQTANGTYTIQAMNGTTGCTSTESGNAVITAKALPSVFTVSGGGTGYCSGGAGIAVTLSATQAGVSYQLWNTPATVGAPIIGAGSAITFPPATTSGTYTIVATNSSSCSSSMSGAAIINILGLPTAYAITGGGAYCQGGSGVPIGMLSSSIGTNYQLMLAGVPVGAPVAGTGVAFSFGSSFTAAGPYTVVATVASTGCSATMTGTATVSINLLPVAHNITGGGNFCPGGTGSVINLDGSNTGTSYQLYAGSALSGAAVAGTNAPITFGSRTTTGVYTVIATNATCTGAMPGSVTIGLSALPVVFNVTGGGNICPSASVAVGLSGSSLGVGYQLYNSLSGPLGPVVPGTGFSLNFGSQTAAGVYTVVAMDNTTSCTNNMSGSATVAINPLPASHTVTGGGNYCQAGSGADVSLDGSDVGTRYQLYIGGVTPVGSYMAGTGMPLDFGSKTAAGNYTVVATSTATTCSSNMTGSAVVAIIPLPGVETVTGGGNYCAGGTGIDNVGLGNSETGVNYQLYNGTTPMGIAVAGTGGALNFGTLTAAGVYTVVGNNPATTCSNTMSGSATVVVNVLPTAYTVVGGGNYCQGGTGVHVMLSGSNVGIAYQLIVDGSAAGVPMAGTGSSLDFGLQTAGGSYTVMANNNTTTCANTMSGSVAVTVNPLPNVYTVIGAGTNYCAGGAGIDMTLSGSDAGINYQLYKGPATAGGAVAGTGFSIDLGSQTAPGTYTVIAVNPSTTCSNTMSGAPAVVVNPLPAAFTVAGGGNYCNGGTGVNVGLSSSNVGVRYQLWNSTTSTASGAAMPGTGGALNFGLQTSAGTYTVVATNMATTCTNTMTGSAIVVVDALPTVTTVTGGGNYCAGSAGAHVNLSGSTAGVNYQLYDGVTPVGAPMGGTGLGIDFGAQAGAGAYTVMAVNTVTSCTDAMAGSVTVGISVLPTAYPVIGGGNYCPGSEGVNVSLSSSNTGISYQLYNGTAPVGAAWPGTGTAISFGTITAAGTYMVVGTNGSTGCSGNMSGTATVGINAQPTVYSVIGGGNYCAGSMGVHVGLNSSNSGINYQLVIDGTASGAPQSGTGGPLDFGMQTTAGSYSVVATNGTTGCTSTMSGTPAVAITPLVSPSVTLSTGTGNDTVCSGHLVSLSALVSNGGTTPVYVWSVNGTPQSAIGSAFSYLPADGDVVTATVTSNAACATPPTVGTSIALSVLENGLPSVALSSAQGTSVCSGTSVTYTAATTFGGTAPTLTWLVNNINVSNAASYSYVPMNNDDIYVEMSSNYRCRTASPVSSNHLMMSVADSVLPTVTIAANPSGANIGSGQQLTLTADVSNGGPTPAYQWFVNGVPITGANLQSYTSNTYSNGDSVTCQVVSSGACTGLVGFNSVIVHISTGVKSVSGITGDIQVVPNPSKGFFIVKGTMSTTMDEEVTLEITDMLGQVVYTGKAMTHNGSINERIQLSNSIANGMYILSLHSDTDNKVFHVVIEQ